MSDDFIPFSDDVEPLSPEEELEAVEDAVDGEGAVEYAPDPPLGRSWAYDFDRGGFRPGHPGPLETRGVETLRYWVEKCLRTPRGAHPVYSDAFGMEGPTDDIGEPVATAGGDLRERITEALLVHPRIIGISDFKATTVEDMLIVSFTVNVRGEGAVPISRLVLEA